jgi:hypothetical protein
MNRDVTLLAKVLAPWAGFKQKAPDDAGAFRQLGYADQYLATTGPGPQLKRQTSSVRMVCTYFLDSS